MLGTGREAVGIEKTESFCNASGIEFVPVVGASAFDSAMSFGMIRGARCVDHIVTEYGVIDITQQGLVLSEIAPGHTPEEIQARVEPKLMIADNLTLMYEK